MPIVDIHITSVCISHIKETIIPEIKKEDKGLVFAWISEYLKSNEKCVFKIRLEMSIIIKEIIMRNIVLNQNRLSAYVIIKMELSVFTSEINSLKKL